MSAVRRRRPEQTLFAFVEEQDERRGGMDDLFAWHTSYCKGARFIELLKSMARFRAYSPYNAMLAAVQRPDATCILSPSKWRRYNRELRRDARPIVLLRPTSPITCVFDVSDTRVMRGQEDRLPEFMAEAMDSDPIDLASDAPVRNILAHLPWWGILHEAVPTGPAACGEIHLADGAEGDMEVPVRAGATVAWRPVYVLRTRRGVAAADGFSALVRELARLFCRHLCCGYAAGWGEGRSVKEGVEEFECALVLWIVGRRLGVRSVAEEEIAAYFEGHEEIPEISMDVVLDAVSKIEKMISDDCTVRDGALYKMEPSFVARMRAGEGTVPEGGDFAQQDVLCL